MTSNINYFSKLSDGINNYNVKDSNAVHSDNTNLKIWTGTKAQYDAISIKDSNTLYNIIDDTDFSLSILEVIYPVGAIYIGIMDVCPLQVLGIGTWTKVSSGRVLQGSDSGHNAGSTIEAGLPNITATGQIGTRYDQGTPTVSGAFSNLRHGGKGSDEPNSTGWLYDFNASTSNSIYGNSSTVQPPAFVVNIWQRTT